MAFADQKMSTGRLYLLIAVVLLHVVLGYLFASGLALKVVKVVTGPLETFEVEEPEVTPKEEPPPPPPQEMEDIPPYVPPPEVVVQTATPPPPTVTVQSAVPAPAIPTPAPAPAPVIAPPAPPAPAPVQRTPATPRGRSNVIDEADYPDASRRAEEEGVVQASFTIGTDGKVVAGSCKIAKSSGFDRLDQATCKIIERRFRYNPAKEGDVAVTENRTQNVRWQLTDG